MFVLFDGCRPGEIRGFFSHSSKNQLILQFILLIFTFFILKSNVIFLTNEIINQGAKL